MSDNKMSGTEVLAVMSRMESLAFESGLDDWKDAKEARAAVATMIEREAAQAKRIAELEAALIRIATQGPHYGPDGTYKTWKHWATIAAEALDEARNG